MRSQLGYSLQARAGDRVRFFVEMPPDTLNVDCALFSAVKGYDLAPHVPRHKAEYLKDGKPLFTTPVLLRLHDQRPTGEICVDIDEDCRLAVMQDIDRRGQPLATVKVWKNDRQQHQIGQRVLSAFGYVVGKWRRLVRRGNADQIR